MLCFPHASTLGTRPPPPLFLIHSFPPLLCLPSRTSPVTNRTGPAKYAFRCDTPLTHLFLFFVSLLFSPLTAHSPTHARSLATWGQSPTLLFILSHLLLSPRPLWPIPVGSPPVSCACHPPGRRTPMHHRVRPPSGYLPVFIFVLRLSHPCHCQHQERVPQDPRYGFPSWVIVSPPPCALGPLHCLSYSRPVSHPCSVRSSCPSSCSSARSTAHPPACLTEDPPTPEPIPNPPLW